MFRYAVVDNNSLSVVNVIIWDGEAQWSPPANHIAVRSDSAGIGDLYDPNTKSIVSIPIISQ